MTENRPERFYKNVEILMEFMERIITKLHKEGKTKVVPEIVDVVKIILSPLSKESILTTFINKSYKYWDQIYDKKEEFITKNAFDVFVDIPKEYIVKFVEMFSTPGLVEEKDRVTIQRHFESFVRISINYVHQWQEPILIDDQMTYRKQWKINDEPIDLKYHALKRNMKLLFPSS